MQLFLFVAMIHVCINELYRIKCGIMWNCCVWQICSNDIDGIRDNIVGRNLMNTVFRMIMLSASDIKKMQI